MWQYIVLSLIGIGAGIIISGGVFSLIVAIGLVSRFAGKTHTGRHVKLYEDFIVLGGIIFNAVWVFEISLGLSNPFGMWLEIFIGILHGIFVGCLAVSLAEALDATAIFARRIKIKMGIAIIVFVVAVSKVIGGLIQFSNNWSK